MERNAPMQGGSTLVKDAIWHRWPIIVAAAALVVIGGHEVTKKDPSYVSSASIILQPIPGNAYRPEVTASSGTVTVAMETEAGLVRSPAILDQVNADLGTSLTTDTHAIAASVPSTSQILTISFTSDTWAEAKAGAASTAEAVLAYRHAQAKQTLDRQVSRLDVQRDQAQNGLTAAAEDLNKDNPPPGAAAQVQLYANRLATLQDLIGQIQATDTDPGSVFAPPTTPTKAGINRNVLLGALGIIGLLVGAALAIWWERRDDRIRVHGRDSLGDAPLIGAVPTPAAGPSLLRDLDPASTVHEAYRQVRIQLLSMSNVPFVVAVCPVTVRGASAPFAVNLAISLSSAGYNVVFVDATGANLPSKLLGVASNRGLSNAITQSGGKLALTHKNGLRILGAGTDPARARERFAGARFRDIIDQLGEGSDIVIVAGPPATSADAAAVSRGADALVLTVVERRDRHVRLDEAVAQAKRQGIPTVVAVAIQQTRHLPRWPSRRSDRPVVQPADGDPAGDGSVTARPTSIGPRSDAPAQVSARKQKFTTGKVRSS